MNSESAPSGVVTSAVMARALDWVVQHIDEFDPFKNGREFDIAHGQRVTELATMLNSYVALTGDRQSPAIQTLVAEARRHQQNRALTDRIMHSPAEFVLFADLYAALKRLGCDDPEQRALIQRVIDAGFLDQVERVPHRNMDVRLTLEWGDFRHRWQSLEALSAQSVLALNPRALFLDESSLYSLTHVIMFLYGFGTRMDAALPLTAAARRQFEQTLSTLLVVTAQEHHWDLLCELLLCWDLLQLAPTRLSRAAWAALLATQTADGAFPGPERALHLSDPARESDPAKQRELYVSHHYHTTLVAVIAAAVHRSRSSDERPATVPVRVIPSGDVRDTDHGADADRAVAGIERTIPFTRARRWLDSQLASLDDERPPAHDPHLERRALDCLVGLHICASVLGEDADMQARARTVARLLTRTAGRDVSTSTPPALLLMAAAILQDHDCLPSHLGEHVATFADVLGRHPAANGLGDLDWCEKRVLLHQLGLHEAPPRVSRDELLALADTIALSGDIATIETLATCVESCTAFGTDVPTLFAHDMWLPELLVGFAAHRFREYELRRATRLLRSATLLTGPGHPLIADCRDFLLLHQDAEGAFGYYGPAREEFMRGAAPGYSFDHDLRLPVTVQCLWTLGECDGDGWRLFSTLAGRTTSLRETTAS